MPNYEPKTCQNIECPWRKHCREFDNVPSEESAIIILLQNPL